MDQTGHAIAERVAAVDVIVEPVSIDILADDIAAEPEDIGNSNENDKSGRGDDEIALEDLVPLEEILNKVLDGFMT